MAATLLTTLYTDPLYSIKYPGVDQAKSGKEVVDVVLAQLDSVSDAKGAYLLFLKNKIQTREDLKTPFGVFANEFRPKSPAGEQLKGATDFTAVHNDLKVLFYTWAQDRLIKDFPELLKYEEMVASLEKILDEPALNSVKLWMFSSSSDIVKRALRGSFFQWFEGKPVAYIREAKSFDDVLRRAAAIQAKRRAQQAGAPQQPRKPQASDFEYLYCWWGFKSEEDLHELNKHGWYPRRKGKLDLAQYRDEKQKEVTALLAEAKGSGNVDGKFLGAANVTAFETLFTDHVLFNDDLSEYPVIGLGVAIAHFNDRKRLLANPTQNNVKYYKRLNAENMRWKWDILTNVPWETINPQTAAAEEHAVEEAVAAAEEAKKSLSDSELPLAWMNHDEFKKFLALLKRVQYTWEIAGTQLLSKLIPGSLPYNGLSLLIAATWTYANKVAPNTSAGEKREVDQHISFFRKNHLNIPQEILENTQKLRTLEKEEIKKEISHLENALKEIRLPKH